jgi:hypothetical protein
MSLKKLDINPCFYLENVRHSQIIDGHYLIKTIFFVVVPSDVSIL